MSTSQPNSRAGHETTPSEPVGVNYLEEDLHELNKEIVRLAYFLSVRLDDEQLVHRVVQGELTVAEEHREQFEILRGLLVLRGKMRQERLENGEPDGTSPVAEAIFTQLRISSSDQAESGRSTTD